MLILKIYQNLRLILKKIFQTLKTIHIVCSFGYKLICIDGEYSRPYKYYFGEDAVSKFISDGIDESIICQRIFGKYFEDSTILLNLGFVRNSIKKEDVKDHCLITEKYRGSAQ